MATPVKRQVAKPKAEKGIDARYKIKPRGLWGLYKDRIHLNGTDEEVFGLTLATNVG
jgi:hypothetical protein